MNGPNSRSLSILKFALYLAAPLFIALIPIAFLESSTSVCLVSNLFHRTCPGCGMTRAISSLFHGAFISAYNYNPLVVIVFPVMSSVWVKNTLNAWQKLRMSAEFNKAC